MPPHLSPSVREWLSAGTGVGRASLVRTEGSGPFEIGSTLYVADDGRIDGAVSAGCVESAVVQAIAEARRGGYRELVRYGVSDERAAEVGLSCGGILHVLVEPDVRATPDWALAVGVPLPSGRETSEPWRIVVGNDAVEGSSGDAELDLAIVAAARQAIGAGRAATVEIGGTAVFVEVLAPFRLVLVGAGEIAVHLARLAHAYGFETTVIDARTAFLTRERFPEAAALLPGWADELADVARIGRGVAVVTLAHDPKFDDPALVAALRRGASYVGALGSRRTHAKRLERLREAGLTDDELQRIHAPVGLDLGANSPRAIALGILAGVVAERNRGSRAG